jgi:hypothetical protein
MPKSPYRKKGIRGVDENGHPDEASLSTRGWQRAGALAFAFCSATTRDHRSLRPSRIYAACPTSGGKLSRRSLQTVVPLAAKLGIAVNIRFGQGDESAVAREMASGSGPALFSWQHEGIPALASHITGENLTATFPSLWPDERFDLVWLFSKSRGAWSFAQFAQKLLAGDSDEPVR